MQGENLNLSRLQFALLRDISGTPISLAALATIRDTTLYPLLWRRKLIGLSASKDSIILTREGRRLLDLYRVGSAPLRTVEAELTERTNRLLSAARARMKRSAA